MNKKKNTKIKSDINAPNKISRIRIVFIIIFIFILMLVLLGRIGYLQFVEGNFLQTKATSQQTLTETISAKRGTIFDANGETTDTSYETIRISSSTKIVRYDEDEDEFTPYAAGTDTLLTINDILDAEGFGTGCSKIAIGVFHNSASSSIPTIEFVVIYD